MREKRLYLAAVVRTPICDADESSSAIRIFHRTKTSLRIVMQDKVKAIMLDARLAGELPSSRGKGNVRASASGPGYVLTEERRAELMAMKRRTVERRSGFHSHAEG